MDNGKTIKQFFLHCDKYPVLPCCFKFASEINKVHEPPQNSRHQKGNMKHIPYWDAQILGATAQNLNFMVTWDIGFMHPCNDTFNI